MSNPYDNSRFPENPFSTVGEQPQPVRVDEILPEVEPPSAGFLIQLFVVPALIVGVIVGFMLLFNALTSGKTDPQQYVRQIASGRVNSWQAAHDLAVEIQRNPEWTKDASMVRELSALLNKQIQERLPQQEAFAKAFIEQVSYLCRILLRCESTAESRTAIVAALGYEHGGKDDHFVRAAAVEALSLEIAALRNSEFASQIEERLIELSRDENSLVRVRAAYVLGLAPAPSETRKSRLKAMLIDAKDDVRFNAATSLARFGELECLPILCQMLQLRSVSESSVSIRETPREKNDREAREVVVLEAALGAVAVLAQKTDINREALQEPEAKIVELIKDADRLPSGARSHLLALAEATQALIVSGKPVDVGASKGS